MGTDIEQIKRRFGIVGFHEALHHAIEVAYQVAPSNLAVLIQGESGVGKEFFPKIIHQYSARKHGRYIAVNCGAIPEGTIDSELFGHVKGSFTGAVENRAGYFEEADGGTIFLDEVAELPLPTQARLLRVLESGEFLRVGSSTAQKTDIRIVAATNVTLEKAIEERKFREDLYYRLSTVPIHVPALRDRGEDAILLFKHFAREFAERYNMPQLELSAEARDLMLNFSWPGNVRQLKNITEQMSIIEKERTLSGETFRRYLYPEGKRPLPAIYTGEESYHHKSERELLYNVLYEMRSDMNEMKSLLQKVLEYIGLAERDGVYPDPNVPVDPIADPYVHPDVVPSTASPRKGRSAISSHFYVEPEPVEERVISLAGVEEQAIRECLDKHQGYRKGAAQELGISERTLYRKIREYKIDVP